MHIVSLFIHLIMIKFLVEKQVAYGVSLSFIHTSDNNSNNSNCESNELNDDNESIEFNHDDESLNKPLKFHDEFNESFHSNKSKISDHMPTNTNGARNEIQFKEATYTQHPFIVEFHNQLFLSYWERCKSTSTDCYIHDEHASHYHKLKFVTMLCNSF